MYSIDINFLKDRQEQKSDKRSGAGKTSISIGSLTPIYLGAAVGLIFPIGVAAGYLFLQSQNAQLENSVAAIDAELNRLGAQEENIKKIQAETTQVQAEARALATVFNQIRPWSAMLQDLRDRIPKGVQIETVEQTAAAAPQPTPQPTPQSGSNTPPPTQPTPTAGGIKISGIARSFSDVNDFLLTLKQSAFLQPAETKIVTAELVDNPTAVPTYSGQAIKIKLPQVVRYTIESSVSNVPASEILRELERKGTFGLVTRIRMLQQRGVIQP